MTIDRDLSRRLRRWASAATELNIFLGCDIEDAADEIERLTTRVAELEACLADVVNQLEMGVKE